MTKKNTRSRIVSILLVLIMLFSLMPSLELHAHAFWEDYDNPRALPAAPARSAPHLYHHPQRE